MEHTLGYRSLLRSLLTCDGHERHIFLRSVCAGIRATGQLDMNVSSLGNEAVVHTYVCTERNLALLRMLCTALV